MSTSQIFTIGTALRRAEDNHVPVEVLVEGQWLRGDIAGLDGDGLVLVTPERTQCVVRSAHISVVRILANLSFDEGEQAEPRQTSYDDARGHQDHDSQTSPFSWASSVRDERRAASSAPAPQPAARSTEPSPSVPNDLPALDGDADDAYAVDSAGSDDRLVLDAAGSGDVLVLDAGSSDDVLVLDAGSSDDVLVLSVGESDDVLVLHASEQEGPLALGSGSALDEGDDLDDLHEGDTLGDDRSAEEVTQDVETELEPVAIADPEPAAIADPEPAAIADPEPAPAVDAPDLREDPTDLVSRLLAESMREAGIDPEASADAAPTMTHAPAAPLTEEITAPITGDTAGEIGGEPAHESSEARATAAPVELLHPDKTPAPDDEPRVFALPAPFVSEAPQTSAPLPSEPAPVAESPVDAPAVSPVEPAPAATGPATAPPAEAAPADDWRSMLEGLRGEAATIAPSEPAQEKRRGRRLVMR